MRRQYGFAITVIVIVLLTGYVSSYFMFTERVTFVSGASLGMVTDGDEGRTCHYEWMTIVYRPLAFVEGMVTGHEIQLEHF